MNIFSGLIFTLSLLLIGDHIPFVNIDNNEHNKTKSMTPQSSPKTIAFYLQDGVEILDFAGPMEVFTYAGYKVFTVSKTKEPIMAQRILKVFADYTIADAPKADILAFFGGNAGAAYKDKEVIDWIKSQTEVDYHFSVCTGAFMLAEAGILDQKVATTFHESLDNLQAEYPNVDVRKEVRFVDNGKVISTAGISAGIDGALHLVAKLKGLSAAKRTAYYMEYDNWVPGDGLILSEDNPYTKVPDDDLGEYAGNYDFKDGNSLKIDLGNRKGELMVHMGDKKFPLYYEKENHFSDINGDTVLFRRDQDKRILGYSLGMDGEIFKKK